MKYAAILLKNTEKAQGLLMPLTLKMQKPLLFFSKKEDIVLKRYILSYQKKNKRKGFGGSRMVT